MNFGEALQALKEGKKVKREIWGGHWQLVKNGILEWPTPGRVGYKGSCEFQNGIIVAQLRDHGGVAPAQPYQADLLSDDWQIVE
jgi:hypothetical protein